MKSLILALTLLCSTACAGNLRPAATPSQLIAQVKPSLVMVSYPIDNDTNGICTGFSVDAARGWVLTARHCVEDDNVVVHLFVNEVSVKVIRKDDEFALIQVTPMTYPPLVIASGPGVVGDVVSAFGYGHGHFTVLARTIAQFDGVDVWIDGPLIKGMSGGPIVDAAGGVVGLNQANNTIGIGSGSGAIRRFLAKTK